MTAHEYGLATKGTSSRPTTKNPVSNRMLKKMRFDALKAGDYKTAIVVKYGQIERKMGRIAALEIRLATKLGLQTDSHDAHSNWPTLGYKKHGQITERSWKESVNVVNPHDHISAESSDVPRIRTRKREVKQFYGNALTKASGIRLAGKAPNIEPSPIRKLLPVPKRIHGALTISGPSYQGQRVWK
jgi:hypothetical protein